MRAISKITGLFLIAAVVGIAWFLGRITVLQDSAADTKIAAPAETLIVTKVVDGDTVVVTGGGHVRLLGIDADEKSYPCYDAAKLRLEELVLGKTVVLESDGEDSDQYGRKLRYIYLEGDNINVKMVAEGFAVARFYPENRKYRDEITSAEASAIKNKTGCKWGDLEPTAITGSEPTGAVYKWEKISGTAIDACDAKNHIGDDLAVEGRVAEIYRSDTGNVFLNFGGEYPDNCFTAVIFKTDLVNFSEMPETAYKSKTIRARGRVREYEGKAEIILENPSQIEIGIVS